MLLWPTLVAIGRLAGIVDFSLVLPVYCSICVLAVLLVSGLRSFSTPLLVGVFVGVYLPLRLLAGEEQLSTGVAVMMAELLSVAVSVLLARRVEQELGVLETAVERTMLERMPVSAQAIEQTQGEIYREVRRARSFERPLTFLAIAPADIGEEKADELIEELQRENLARYVTARIVSLMSEEMRDYDIVSTRDDYIMTVLPETGAEQVAEVVERLRTTCKERLGVELKIGASSFPDQEYTFDKLLKRAEAEMRGEPQGAGMLSKRPGESATLAG